MGSNNNNKDTTVAAAAYWGYLIKPDRTPSPLFEQLLLGVAQYIIKHIAPWDTHTLTPAKLAHFYRLVGGDYDPLFLDTSQSSLSFIYQSLGCLHTLQPEKDPFSPPTVPALTPAGFVRWQTVQLLLEPDEHVPFLQEAVKRFELTNPSDGEPFPSILPRETLPQKPDAQMIAWHDTVSDKLMLEAQASQMRQMPPRPQMALSDAGDDPIEPSRPKYSSIEPSPLLSTAKHYHAPPNATYKPTPSTNRSMPRSPAKRNTIQTPHPQPQPQPPHHNDAPWSPLRRRSSMPSDQSHPPPSSSTSWRTSYPPHRPTHTHARTPSTISSSSFTSDSSYTTSSASASAAASPVLQPSTPLYPSTTPHHHHNQHHHHHGSAGAGVGMGADIRRSQSLGYFSQPNSAHPPPYSPSYPSQQQQMLGLNRRPSSAARHSGEWSPGPNGNGNGNGNGARPPGAARVKQNDRGRGVRWPDQEGQRLERSATVRATAAGAAVGMGNGNGGGRAKSVEGRKGGGERGKLRRGESVGVGGRRYG